MLCAIYCRLSKEDLKEDLKEELKEDSQRDLFACGAESESIQNQKSLLVNYAKNAGWTVYKIYCDEDYSGIDGDRPGFRQLLADAEAKKFQIILCKTQSRFTRDMELVESYIHHKFLLWGIRFVAVVDNIDTEVKGNKKTRQINGLVNQWYLEDLSENIRTIFDHKRKQGKFIGSFCCYGYQKDPLDHNKLIIDPEAAVVVQKIFALYQQGYGKQKISQILNQQGIPNPTKYKQIRGLNYVNGCATDNYGLWNKTTIGRILKNYMYLGTMVQGTRKKVSYKSKKVETVPTNSWYVVPRTHQSIIAEADFLAVQAQLATKTRQTKEGLVHPLAGKVKCLACHSTMIKTTTSYKGVARSYLRCKLHNRKQQLCQGNSINLADLVKEIELCLKRLLQDWYQLPSEDFFVAEKKSEPKQNKELFWLQNQIAQRGEAIKNLYLDKTKGIIGDEQFVELNQAFLQEKNQLESRLQEITLKHKLVGQQFEGKLFHSKAAEILQKQSLDLELANLLIESVLVEPLNKADGSRKIIINWLI